MAKTTNLRRHADGTFPPSDVDRDDRRASEEADSDVLIKDYRTILTELALLTTVSVLLFGFLLSNAGSFAGSRLEEWIFAVTVIVVASATLVFVLPVAYHHLQFPYHDFPKFQLRSHRWVQMGLPLLGLGLYLSLCLAIWSLLDAWALLIAATPIAATAGFFALRKGQL
jgi:hypothetical protein